MEKKNICHPLTSEKNRGILRVDIGTPLGTVGSITAQAGGLIHVSLPT